MIFPVVVGSFGLAALTEGAERDVQRVTKPADNGAARGVGDGLDGEGAGGVGADF